MEPFWATPGEICYPESVRYDLSDYDISTADAAPIVIGGIGGSGTRLVVQILQKEGVSFPGHLNDELDNLWFSLLFVRRTILLKPRHEVKRLIWLFVNAMRSGLPVPEELAPLLDEAARHDRGPALRKSVLDDAHRSLCNAGRSNCIADLWGWKQPNSHVLVPVLAQYLPQMKYIYVVRNGLDMAFSYNQNQLKYFWGDLMLEGDIEPTPHNALRYWIASYRRIIGDRALLGDRLYILNFDSLCINPVEQLNHVNAFLGLNVSQATIESIAQIITVPTSAGRFKHQDCSQLCPEDIAYVRSLGFDTDIVQYSV